MRRSILLAGLYAVWLVCSNAGHAENVSAASGSSLTAPDKASINKTSTAKVSTDKASSVKASSDSISTDSTSTFTSGRDARAPGVEVQDPSSRTDNASTDATSTDNASTDKKGSTSTHSTSTKSERDASDSGVKEQDSSTSESAATELEPQKFKAMPEPALDVPDRKSGAEEMHEAPRFNTKLHGGIQHHSLMSKVHHQRMTSDDFRRLEYGVLGLVALNRQFFAALPVVTEVFPTCPAAMAGILPGDVLISEDGHNYKPGAGQKEVWATLGGKAGTKVSLTVRRRTKFLTFQMVRMNIEDVKDDRVRHTFESILKTYGPPGSSRPDDN